jgi:hypothetical protein
MHLSVPIGKLLSESLQSQVDIFHRLDRHALVTIVHVTLYRPRDDNQRRALLSHILKEGLNP